MFVASVVWDDVGGGLRLDDVENDLKEKLVGGFGKAVFKRAFDKEFGGYL